MLEPDLLQQRDQVIGAFGKPAVLRRNRWPADPILQARHRAVMIFGDLRLERSGIRVRRHCLIHHSCRQNGGQQ